MSSTLQRAFSDLTAEATTLAGGLADLTQRATIYHHLYHASAGNHAFPLIAAHGSLWARGYFARRLKLARLLAWQFPFSKKRRVEALTQLGEFANVFRDINRRVCIDSYVNFHFTERYADHPDVEQVVEAPLLEAMRLLHNAIRNERVLSDEERRHVFEIHFLSEQERVVGPLIEVALERFNWPLVKAMALKPTVAFSYLSKAERLRFSDFSDMQ